jgi:D-alanine-D-alanine ligase
MDAHRTPSGVVVLYNHSERLVKGEPQDLLADQGVIVCAHAIADALAAGNESVVLVPVTGDVEAALEPFPPTEWLVFNLAEGLDGRLFEETRMAWALEAMGYRFTGADAAALALSTQKARAKEALARAGVSTPSWRLFRHPQEVTEASVQGLPLPLIVKPVAEDASLGVGAESVVHSIEGLRQRVAYVVERYRQAALAEEFIDGREFNISVWGEPPEVLPIAEIDFTAFEGTYDRIVSFAAKWENESFAFNNTPVVCPAPVSPALERRIREVALAAWKAMGCRGYARIDMRVSPQDVPYVIEVNCNPDLSPDAGFFRAARAAGNTYRDMVLKILEVSLEHKASYDRNSTAERRQSDSGHHREGRRLQADGDRLRRGTLERVS